MVTPVSLGLGVASRKELLKPKRSWGGVKLDLPCDKEKKKTHVEQKSPLRHVGGYEKQSQLAGRRAATPPLTLQGTHTGLLGWNLLPACGQGMAVLGQAQDQSRYGTYKAGTREEVSNYLCAMTQ